MKLKFKSAIVYSLFLNLAFFASPAWADPREEAIQSIMESITLIESYGSGDPSNSLANTAQQVWKMIHTWEVTYCIVDQENDYQCQLNDCQALLELFVRLDSRLDILKADRSSVVLRDPKKYREKFDRDLTRRILWLRRDVATRTGDTLTAQSILDRLSKAASQDKTQIFQKDLVGVIADFLNLAERARFAGVDKNSNQGVRLINERNSFNLVDEVERVYEEKGCEAIRIIAMSSKINAYIPNSLYLAENHAQWKNQIMRDFAQLVAGKFDSRVVDYKLDHSYVGKRVLTVTDANLPHLSEVGLELKKPYSYIRKSPEIMLMEVLFPPFLLVRAVEAIYYWERNHANNGEVSYLEATQAINESPTTWTDELKINTQVERRSISHSVFSSLRLIGNDGQKKKLMQLRIQETKY